MMVICPVCGQFEFEEDSGDVCPVCGWAEDPVQVRHPDWKGENTITLNEARKRYAEYGTIGSKKIEVIKKSRLAGVK